MDVRSARSTASRCTLGVIALLLSVALIWGAQAADLPASWASEWPRTDFSKSAVDLREILSGGPPRDGIPAVDRPQFAPADQVTDMGENEPVISVFLNGEKRAYPLRILIWHEIVNDVVGDVPIAVTFCPLCNSAVVFDRRVGDRVLDFGTTGKLRNSDLVMYDRQTESWWQQFTGEAIVGACTGARLTALPARIESIAIFRTRAGAEGTVLLPPSVHMRSYGLNPYSKYDSAARPFLYRGGMPADIAPLARVIVVGEEAWSLELLQAVKRIESGDLVITWQPGQNSALDTSMIKLGRDVGNVVVQRRTASGLHDAVHDVSFAFAFHAFHPHGTIHVAPNQR